MTLPTPNLDDRRFDDLLRELQLLIPTYTPELALGRDDWTDWNESDPGTTLLQLWAHLAETILYRLNRLPDLAHVKLLELVGLQLRPARAATADLTFTPQPGFRPPPHATGITVPALTQVRAQPPDGGEPLTFETEAGLDLVRAELASVQVADGGSFVSVTELNAPDASAFRPLGWIPQPGNALYLGFAPPDPPAVGRVFPAALRLRVAPPRGPGPAPARGGPTPPAPPATLQWEYRRRPDEPRWRPLRTFEDGTAALTRGGYLLVEGPAEIEPVEQVGAVAEPRLWLRCRLVAGSYPAGAAPEVDMVVPNTVRAQNLATIRDEVVGTSEGHPGQTFVLRRVPMQPESLAVEVEEGADGAFVAWERRDDLLAADPQDRAYAVDGASGTLTFGDGRRGRIPLAGARIVARVYRHGASAAGNLAAGTITTIATHVPGVQAVVNLLPSVGGADVQRIEDLRRDAPAMLRARGRAVCTADFEELARQVGTVARARALPLTHPDHRGVAVPGSVTVVVVPAADEAAPRPSPDLLDAVYRHLDAVRPVATELHVVGPRYRRLRVVCRVEAEPAASFDTVALAVAAAVDAALSPTHREFGRDLAPTSLYSVLLGVADVTAVPVLQVELDGSPWDDLGTSIVLEPDELLAGAEGHEVAVVPRTDRTTRGLP
jgi:predicted phage baseplate assembly protein